MAFSDVTNGSFDTACAAVPAPFGPFARVDSVASVSPNSHLPVKCSAFSGTVTFSVSYDVLTHADLLQEFIKNTFGLDWLMHQIKLILETINAHVLDIAPPLTTAAEERNILKSLGLIPTLFGMMPWRAFTEYDPSLKVEASFVGTATGASLALTQTITGQYYWYYWDFGDGTSSIAANPTHVYETSGSKTVRLVVIGAGGTVEARKAFTITVPPTVTASFTGTATGASLALNQTVTGDTVMQVWDFGDDEASLANDPTHVYDQSGTYTVTLTVFGEDGSVTEVEHDYTITVPG